MNNDNRFGTPISGPIPSLKHSAFSQNERKLEDMVQQANDKMVTIDTAQTITGTKEFYIDGDMRFQGAPSGGRILINAWTKYEYPPYIQSPDEAGGRHILFHTGTIPPYGRYDVGTETCALWWDKAVEKFKYSYGTANPPTTKTIATTEDITDSETTASMKVAVSNNDTTPSYLGSKLTAGTGITLTENNDGGNETLTVAVPNDHAVGSDNQNLFATISSDSGSTTADSETDTLTVAGSGGINTSVSGDTLTVGIADSAISEVKLNISNSPSDGKFLKYSSADSKMKWDTVSQPEPWTVNNEFQETPDGVTTVFTVVGDEYISGGIIVTLNGQILNTTQWSEVDPDEGTIEFAIAPSSDDEIRWHGAGAGSLGGTSSAEDVSITDSAEYFTSDNVEGALQEIGLSISSITDTDEKVKVSSADTTSGYLEDKIVAGSNITVTKNNTGGNETLTVASTASGGGGGAWEIVEYRVVSANCDYVDFTVTGSNYHKFEITLNMINGNTTSAITYYLYLNKDYTNSNYSNQMHYTAINGASLGSWRGAVPHVGGGNSLAPNMQCSSKIDELKRTVNGYADFNYFDRCNYTVGSTGVRVDFGSIYYTQAIDEITDIRIASNLTDGVGAGSEIIIMGLKKS